MADDEFQGSGNWWELASRGSSTTRFDGGGGGGGGGGGDPNLQLMGLGLSSQPMDWNNHPSSFIGGEKDCSSGNNSNFQQEVEWREKLLFSASESSSSTNRGFSLDQSQFSPQYNSTGDSSVTTTTNNSSSTTSNNNNSFQNMDLYGNSSILQGLLAVPPPQPDHHHHHQQATSSLFDHHRSSMNFGYPTSYTSSNTSSDPLMASPSPIPSPSASAWSSKVPQFLRGSPPKQQNQLHFTNNAPFWNANNSVNPNIKDVSSTFFPSLQPSFSTPNFPQQSKNICEVRDSGTTVKKSGSDAAPKRPRNETNPSPLPAFKVRKEKMGDRITALQQLVSPFGKTDTASVLSEAIEYIKFLHEQVTVLSTPYMKSTGAPIQHQQSPGKSKEGEGPKQDLRSRGLCLVPVSSTFPVTHETTVDFWTPTFGGTYR